MESTKPSVTRPQPSASATKFVNWMFRWVERTPRRLRRPLFWAAVVIVVFVPGLWANVHIETMVEQHDKLYDLD